VRTKGLKKVYNLLIVLDILSEAYEELSANTFTNNIDEGSTKLQHMMNRGSSIYIQKINLLTTN